MPDPHRAAIDRARAAVAAAQAAAAADPLRPTYHLTAPAHWLSDPNGLIFYDGAYHLFYQHNPFGPQWGNMSWGHARSRDLVRWEHLPPALTPTPGGPDKDGVFSGCCVVQDGVPTIVYTGVQPESQCLARSHDGLLTWEKYPGNPVLTTPPDLPLTGFRDPFVWREEDAWYLLVGAGIRDRGGAALLYRSADLLYWDYLHPLCPGFGQMWECPNFFPLGGQHVLIVSPEDEVRYAVGEYAGRRFHPGPWRLLDGGGCAGFYAPNTLVDNRDRRIMWGWIQGGGTPGSPWQGLLTLPRLLSLLPGDRLGQVPVPELRQLRQRAYHCTTGPLLPDRDRPLPAIDPRAVEIVLECDLGTAAAFGIRWACDRNGVLTLVYDRAAGNLSVGTKTMAIEGEEGPVKLHLFLDRSVYELFVDYRQCLTGRYQPWAAAPDRPLLFARGGEAVIRRLELWELG